MAISTVINVKGEVFAVTREGVEHRLQNGDTLQEGEVLVTAPGSSAELDMGGGKAVSVPEQQTLTVDEAVGGPVTPDAASSALESAAAAQKVIQALASGDANALLEAAAADFAGGGGADGGSSFVQLLHISEGVTPVGYADSETLRATVGAMQGAGNDITFGQEGNSDKLDLRDLLVGEHSGGTPNLSSFLHFTYDSGTNTTTVDVKTSGTGAVNQQIVLEHFDVTAYHAIGDDAAIAAALILAGKLIVDS